MLLLIPSAFLVREENKKRERKRRAAQIWKRRGKNEIRSWFIKRGVMALWDMNKF